ncbi:ABC transporter permease [Saccharopolyspora shandongensis]|uniref:ABC transporter permease n=1 Tax=Saccharopolyspora shandongensis TaxID=418495 RepID=UPI0033CA14E1
MADRTDYSPIPAQAAPRRRRTLVGRLPRPLRAPLFVVAALIAAGYVLMAVWPSLFTSADPMHCELRLSGAGPAPGHPFGFDMQGCDYFANVVHGARPSIAIGLLVTAVTFVLAAVLGALAGYFGGIVDGVVSRIADVVFGLPMIIAAIVVLNLFEERTIWTVSLVLIVFGWPGGMRYMRGSVLKIRNLEYVQAARVLGGSHLRIMGTHIAPNALTSLIVLKTLEIGGVIAAEAALTFLGIGLQPPAISWGLQLSTAQQQWQASPHLLVYPALFLTGAVLAFVVLGDSLRETLDPKGKKS